MKRLLFAFVVLCSLVVVAQEGKIKFAVLADTHVGSYASATQDLRDAIADINSQSDIDFIIIAGDITEFGTDEEIMAVKKELEANKKPYLFVPGNHDTNWSESGCTTFNKVMGGSQFRYMFKGMLFLGISSGPYMRMGPCQAPREDIEWLAENLKNTPEDTPVVFVCHSPLTLTAIANADQIIDLLKTRNIQFVIAGHYHVDSLEDFEGIPGFLCRSSLRTKAPCGGYTIFTIDGGKVEAAERRPCEGKTREAWASVTLKKFDAASTPHPARQDYTAENARTSRITQLWHVQDHSDIASGIIQEGKVVYFTNTLGELRALDAKTGKYLWTFSTGDKIYSEPVYHDKNIYFTSTDGGVYCVSARKGKLVWKHMTDYPILSTPAIEGDTVYVAGGKGRFYAFDAVTGKKLWQYEGIKGYMEARPAIGRDVVAIGSWAAEFNAVNKKDGTLSWKYAPGISRYYSPGATWPVAYGGRIYAQSADYNLYCFDEKDGRIIWASKKPNGRESLGAEPDGSILYVKSINDYVVAIDATADTYKELWRANVGMGPEYGPTRITVNDTKAFIPTGNGKVYCLDKKTGETLWCHRFSSSLITCVYPVGQEALIVTTMGGGIHYMKL